MGKIISNGIEYTNPIGTTVIPNPEGTPTDELTSIQIGNDIYEITGSGGGSYTDVTGTLTAGQTSITLSNGYISDNCTFDFYTSKFGVNPTDVSVSNGSITLIFDEQEENINIKVRLYDYIIPTFKNYAKFNGTGIVLPFEINSNYKIICDFYETTYQTGQCIVGDTYSESVSGILLYTDSNSYVIGHGGYSGINSIIASWSSGLHNIIVNNDSSQCVLDNTNTESFTPTTLSNYYYTVGCKVNANTRPYYGYIKEYKIESLLTGDVICDLKPAIVNNNACLFDIITGNIYTATNMTVVDIIPSE